MKNKILLLLFISTTLFAQFNIPTGSKPILTIPDINLGTQTQGDTLQRNLEININKKYAVIDSITGVTLQPNVSILADSIVYAENTDAWVVTGDQDSTLITLSDSSYRFSSVPTELNPNPNFDFSYTDLFDVGAGTFASGTYHWVAYGTNTIANVSNELKITCVDNPNGAYLYFRDTYDLTSDLTLNAYYLVKYDAYVNTGSVTILVNSGTTGYYYAHITNTTKQSFYKVIQAASTTGCFMNMTGTMGVGEIIYLDNISIQQLVPPTGWTAPTMDASNYVIENSGCKFVEATGTTYIELSGLENGKTYNLQGTVSSYTSGELNAYNGSTETLLKGSAGSFNINVTMASTTLRLQVDNNSNLTLAELNITEVFEETSAKLPLTTELNHYYEAVVEYKKDSLDATPIVSFNNNTSFTLNPLTTSWQYDTLGFWGAVENDYLSFDGVNDYIAISKITLSSDFDIYIKGNTILDKILLSYSTTNFLHIDASGHFAFRATSLQNATTSYSAYSPTTLSLFRINRVGSNVRFYVDNNLVGQTSNNAVFDVSDIFRRANGTKYVDGDLFYIKIIDNGDTVLNLNGTDGNISTTTWTDVSGNGNDGTISGATLMQPPFFEITTDDTCKMNFKINSIEQVRDKIKVVKGTTSTIGIVTDISTVGTIADVGTVHTTLGDYTFNVSGNVDYSIADYYVSNSGDDANDGLSEETAWQTLTKVMDFDTSTGFNAGDNIYFDASSTFEFTNLTLTSSGTEEAPIIINTYNGVQPVFTSSQLLSDYIVKEVPTTTTYDTVSQNLLSTSKVTIGMEYYTGYKVTFTEGTLTKYFALSGETSPVKSQAKLYTSSDNINFTVVPNSQSEVLESTTLGINTYNLQTPINVEAGEYWIVLVANATRYVPYTSLTTGDSNYFYHGYSNAWNAGATEATFLSSITSSTSRTLVDVAIGAEIETTSGGLTGTIYKTVLANVSQVRMNGDEGVLANIVDYDSLDSENEVSIIADSVFVFNDTTANYAIMQGHGLQIDGDNYIVKNLYIHRQDSGIVLNGRNIIVDSVYFANNNLAIVNNDLNTIKQNKFIQNKSIVINDSSTINSNWFINSGLNGYSTLDFQNGKSNVIHNSFYNTIGNGKAFVENIDAVDSLVNNVFFSDALDYLIYTDSLFPFTSNNAYAGTRNYYYNENTYNSGSSWTSAIGESDAVLLDDPLFASLYDLNLQDNTSPLIDHGRNTSITIDINSNVIPYNSGIADIGASEFQGDYVEGGGESDGSIIADYYFDSVFGNDANSGTSENSPKQTLSALQTLLSGSSSGKVFALKRNSNWIGNLTISVSGTLGDSTVLTSYGSGNKPIITNRDDLPNWGNTSNWTLATGSVNANVWFIYLNCNVAIDRMWFDDVEVKLAVDYQTSDDNGDGTYGVNSTHKFYFDNTNNLLYVYSLSNPATYYSSMEIPFQISGGVANLRTINLQADYIKLSNLDVQGGAYTSIGLNGADNINIVGCNVGKYSNWSAIVGDERTATDKTSNNVTVSNCVIDSDWEYDYVFYTARTPYGVVAGSGTENWNIYNNTIIDWWMNVYVIGRYADTKNHNIHNNDISAPRFSFSKAIQISSGGTWGTDEATNVKFYNNYIYDVKFGVQISADSNYLYFNIFANLDELSGNLHAPSGGWGISIIADGQSASSSYNYFINNTFYNLLDYAVIYDGKYANFTNNLFVNTGTSKTAQTASNITSHATYRNNLFYKNSATTSSYRLQHNDVGYYTLTQLNTKTDASNNITGIGNIEVIGVVSDVIESDYSLPFDSEASEAGYSSEAILDILGASFYDQQGNQVTTSGGSLVNGIINIGAVNN